MNMHRALTAYSAERDRHLKRIGRQIERAENALAHAREAGDTWAERQNMKAVRAARAEYAREVPA